jgi:hypothetical protein
LAQKKYWSIVKKIYGNKKGMGIPVIEVGAKQLTTSTDKALAFTKFFKSQQTLAEPIGHQLPPFDLKTDLRLSEIQTTPSEIKNILNSLELGKAHGADGISVRLLKETANIISTLLCTLINESFACEKVPSTWKKANVSPIFTRRTPDQ